MESTISSLISAAESGDSVAAGALFSALYAELHRLAKRELARHGAPASLSVTTLLHEAYLEISAAALRVRTRRASWGTPRESCADSSSIMPGTAAR